MKAKRAAVLAGVLLGLLLVVAPAGANADGSSPKAFNNTMGAALAGGSSLWAFVASEQGPRQNKLSAFRRTSGGWRKDPALKAGASPDYSILSATPAGSPDTPCLGYVDGRGHSHLQCRVDGDWQSMLPGAATNDLGQLSDLSPHGSGLLALFEQHVGRKNTASLLSIDTGGMVEPIGPPLELPRQSLAGISDGPQVALAVEELNSGRRYVVSSNDSGWSAFSRPLTIASEGPMIGGGAAVGEVQLLPVTDTGSRPWGFSVYSASSGEHWKRVSGGPLSEGPGDAQGVLQRAGGRVYAMWQEQALRHGVFRTRIAISRFSARTEAFGSRTTLWRGRSPGPDSLDVAQAGGDYFALYVRGTARGRSTRLAVDRLGASASGARDTDRGERQRPLVLQLVSGR